MKDIRRPRGNEITYSGNFVIVDGIQEDQIGFQWRNLAASIYEHTNSVRKILVELRNSFTSFAVMLICMWLCQD